MYDVAIRTLNDLIHLDVDAIHAYRDAVLACEIAEIKDQLVTFLRDHQHHVTVLAAVVRSLGGEPAGDEGVEGFIVEGFTAISGRGDRGALLAMRSNEELTISRYGAARKINVDSPEAMAAIERNYQDDARHLAWIRDTIQSRSWEEEPGREQAA